MKPFVKWAGGKRQILSRIEDFIKDSVDKDTSYTYLEPFVGGGAVFFHQHPKKAIINDLNSDLINAYNVIKSNDYEALIEKLKEHEENYKSNSEDYDAESYYYDIRAWDREPGWPNKYTKVERAARMIFLNRTCYNGLYRVNNKGQFNTPIGRYKNPTICDAENIRELHNYLSSSENKIRIMNKSYEECIREAKDADLIYLDPPYDYEDDDGFTKYQMNGFTFDDFKKLKDECDKALERGAFVIISNNATQKVIDLFEQDAKYKIFYDANKFSTLRTINCNGQNRKSGEEVIIWGSSNNFPFPQANDINKIISILMSDESVLSDKEKVMEIINVTSPRQVAYYFSAMQFLGLLTYDKKFSKDAKYICGSKSKIESYIYAFLEKSDLFKITYDAFKTTHKIDKEFVKDVVKKSIKEDMLSDSTIERRVSTINAWVNWMYTIDDKTIRFLV